MDEPLNRHALRRNPPENAGEIKSTTGTFLAGFPPRELERLARLRRAFAPGSPLDTTPEFHRLMFARWLVEYHRLDG